MKKYIYLTLVIPTLLALSGCATNDSGPVGNPYIPGTIAPPMENENPLPNYRQ